MRKAKRDPDSFEHVLERLKLGEKKSDAEHEAEAELIARAALDKAKVVGASPLAILMAAVHLVKEAHDRTLLEQEKLSVAVEALLTAAIEADDEEAEDPSDDE